jgi:hypothetical protein
MVTVFENMRFLLLPCLLLLAVGCNSGYLHVNSRTDCGNPVLIKLYFQRGNLDSSDKSLLDSLIARCLRANPCDEPAISQILAKPTELTEDDYTVINRLMNDCDNYRTIKPVPAWKSVLTVVAGIAALLPLIPLYVLIRSLGRAS